MCAFRGQRASSELAMHNNKSIGCSIEESPKWITKPIYHLPPHIKNKRNLASSRVETVNGGLSTSIWEISTGRRKTNIAKNNGQVVDVGTDLIRDFKA